MLKMNSMTSSQYALATEAPQSTADAGADGTVRSMKAELKDLMDSGAVVLDGKRANRGKRTSKPLIEEILEEDEDIRAEFLDDVDMDDLESNDEIEGSDVSDSEVEDEVSLGGEDDMEDETAVEGGDIEVEDAVEEMVGKQTEEELLKQAPHGDGVLRHLQ